MPPKAQKADKPATKPATTTPAPTTTTTTTTTTAPAKTTTAPAKTTSSTPAPVAKVDLIHAAYDGEPAVPERKKKTQNPSSSSSSSSSSTESGAASFTFTLDASLVGDKTSAQIKSKLNTELFGYGVIDEVRVTNEATADEAESTEEEADASTSPKNKVVVVFFSKVLGKGLPIFEGFEKDETQKITVFDTEITVEKHDGKASGGGRASKTAHKKPVKKEGEGGRGGRGGGGRGRGSDSRGRGGDRGRGSERGRGRGQ